MMTTILIALASRLRLGADCSPRSSRARLFSLVLFYLAPLPLDGRRARMGPAQRHHRGIAAAIGLGAIFGLPYCIAFVSHRCTAGLVARTSRAAGTAGRHECSSRQRRCAAGTGAGVVSGRPHPALDCRFLPR